jgi:hypothetical protein
MEQRGDTYRKGQINNMNWMSMRTTETTSCLSKTHNWKSPGGDQTPNYWLKAFPDTHSFITKIFNSVVEEPRQMPEWTTTGITYKIRTYYGSEKLPTDYLLTDYV